MDRRQQPDALARLPTRYQVGSHEIQVALSSNWTWSCAVDGGELTGRFDTQAEAWENGVRECARRDGAAAH